MEGRWFLLSHIKWELIDQLSWKWVKYIGRKHTLDNIEREVNMRVHFREQKEVNSWEWRKTFKSYENWVWRTLLEGEPKKDVNAPWKPGYHGDTSMLGLDVLGGKNHYLLPGQEDPVVRRKWWIQSCVFPEKWKVEFHSKRDGNPGRHCDHGWRRGRFANPMKKKSMETNKNKIHIK